MKQLTEILIFALGVTLASCSQPKNSDYILLVRYSEHTICRALDNAGQIVDYDSHDCDDYWTDIDNFSEFFHSKRILYFDGEVSFSDEDKLILWDYVPFVTKLPLEHSQIKIDTILNNSTLKFIFNNRVIELSENSIYRDTLEYAKTIDDQKIENTTVIRVENLGLIKKTNIIDNKNWETQKINLRLTPTTVIISPKSEYNGEQTDFANYLINHIDFSILDRTKSENNTLVLDIYPNEKGEVAEILFLRVVSPAFDKHVFELIKNMTRVDYLMNVNDDIPAKIRVLIYAENTD